VSNDVFRIPLYLPSQAAAETEATITKWNFSAGDVFKKGQILGEIESAKASFDFEAPCEGTVVRLLCVEGDTVSFEEPVMEIETSDVSMKNAIPAAQAAKTAPPRPVPHLAAAGAASLTDSGRTVSILGIGGYLPDRVVSNKELLREFPSVTEEYIFGVTGIRERRWARDGEKPSDMAFHASSEAIRRSGLDPKDIGGIIVSTETPDITMPSTACILQDMLGLRGILAFDLKAACSGWLYGLTIAKGLVLSGVADDILVTGVEMQSQLLDKTDMGTYFLFGDGAGAAVVSGRRRGHAMKQAILKADSKGLQLARRAVPGFKIPLGLENLNPWIRLDGHALFRFATGGFAAIIQDVIAANGWNPEDVGWVVPHQANARILKAAAQKCGVPFDRFYINIDRLGNTSSASIPLALLDLQKDLKPGDKLVLCSVGAGVTIAALTVEW
jgi:3-oxoacyl-(acyl-carrier-protein) synthase III